MAIAILAQVILRAHFGNYLIAQESLVLIAHGVIERATHRVFQRAMPLIRISFDKVISRGTGRVADISGTNEDTDHYRNLLLRDEIVNYIEHAMIAVPFGVPICIPLAILEHHHRGWRLGVI